MSFHAIWIEKMLLTSEDVRISETNANLVNPEIKGFKNDVLDVCTGDSILLYQDVLSSLSFLLCRVRHI